jgi:hypothetical protein
MLHDADRVGWPCEWGGSSINRDDLEVVAQVQAIRMEAGIADHVWTVEEIVGLVQEEATRRRRRLGTTPRCGTARRFPGPE